MKRIWNLLFGAVLGLLLGWSLGYLRLPVLGKSHSFWVGFISCLALVSLLFLLILALRKHFRHVGVSSQNQAPLSTAPASKPRSRTWMTIAVFIVIVGVVGAMLFQQNSFSKTLEEANTQHDQEQAKLGESLKQGQLAFLMKDLLTLLHESSHSTSNDTLSAATIDKIVALSYSFKPYHLLVGDSLTQHKYSPERGQLLLALCKMNFDSASFRTLKNQTSFAHADLRAVDLRGADLSGVNLKGANLKEAKLDNANFYEANLRETNLWGAHLNNSNLSKANLLRANLQWTELNASSFKQATLSGADVTNAQLRKADLRGAIIEWAKIGSTILTQANLTGANLKGSNFLRANLKEANLSATKLVWTDFSEADLTGVELTNAGIHQNNWLELLIEWQVIGASAIKEDYEKVEGDPKISKFQLVKIEE